jgi:hypothetical protein
LVEVEFLGGVFGLRVGALWWHTDSLHVLSVVMSLSCLSDVIQSKGSGVTVW